MERSYLRHLERERDEMARLSLGILRLLDARSRCAIRILRLKDEHGVPVRDIAREAQLLDWLASHNQGPLADESVRSIFRAILDATVALMEREREKTTTSVGAANRVGPVRST